MLLIQALGSLCQHPPISKAAMLGASQPSVYSRLNPPLLFIHRNHQPCCYFFFPSFPKFPAWDFSIGQQLTLCW